MTYTFIGLDIETTGLHLDKGHKVCQVATTTLDLKDHFVSDVGWGHGEYNFSVEALDVNGFTVQRIERGPRASEVGTGLWNWLGNRPTAERCVIPIGWNVGSFDIPFVKAQLGRANVYFPHRAIDLNSLVFTIAGPYDFDDFKRELVVRAEAQVASRGFEVKPHDALSDARVSVEAWHLLKDEHIWRVGRV